MSRLIVVSNRVSIPRGRDSAQAGGLAVALYAALRRYDGIWFGWSGNIVDTSGEGQPNISKVSNVTVVTIDLSTDDYDEYYNGFANRTLWPLFHYRTDLAAYDRKFDKGYFRVNARFAHSLAPMVEPDDLIWVHDYHLIGCAEELRRMGLAQKIGFFLHIPFPATEILLTLPNHKALVRALFAYDLVGFQTESDLRAFHDYVMFEAGGSISPTGELTAYGRTIRAGVFPIGIDAKEFVTMAESAEAKRHFDRMRHSMGQRKLIIGVDRLDYSKGLPTRLESFERLLETYPENRGAVSLLQVATPSRVEVPEYDDIRQELEALSGHINGRFADFDWVPIRYISRAYSQRALAGLFRVSRIGLVTPLRDGMNLVAKEFVAAQDPANPGVLVLSRFAGASDQMTDALIVNPYDVDDIVEALQRGLNFSLAERRKRWRRLMEVVREEDVTAWRDDFVGALQAVPQTVV